MEQVLQELINKQPKLCVLATVSRDGSPESAVVGYAVRDDLTLIFITKKGTRKYTNLHSNANVSFVTGWSFSEKNIQIDGTATLFEDISSVDFQQLDEFFFTQNPDARKFKTDDSVFIVMKPTWYRLLDLTVLPPTEEEKTIEMAS